jgi:hypothetical protein
VRKAAIARSIGLPYYPVAPLGKPSNVIFYGEAHISVLAGDLYFFALASPRKPPGDEAFLGDVRLKPLLSPGEYARKVEEVAKRIFEEASTPEASFQLGGFRGIVKAIIAHLTGREEKSPIKATPRLEWKLASDYIKRILGLKPGLKVQVGGPLYYARFNVEQLSDGSFKVFVWRNGKLEEFRVLEILSKRIESVRSTLEEALRSGGREWSR